MKDGNALSIIIKQCCQPAAVLKPAGVTQELSDAGVQMMQ